MAKKKPDDGAQFTLYFGPVLDALRALGGSGAPSEVVSRIASDLRVPDDVQNELLPSGESRFRNQVAWARMYLVNEGLVDRSKRGVWSLTERGRTTFLSREHAREIVRKWVRIHQEKRKARAGAPEALPEEIAEEVGAHENIHRKQVLDLMQDLPAKGFEQLCQRILREAGFTEVNVTGRSGDQGIDGHGTLQINPLVSSINSIDDAPSREASRLASAVKVPVVMMIPLSARPVIAPRKSRTCEGVTDSL